MHTQESKAPPQSIPLVVKYKTTNPEQFFVIELQIY